MTRYIWFSLIAVLMGLVTWLALMSSAPTTGSVASRAIVSSGPSLHEVAVVYAAIVAILTFLLISGISALWQRRPRARSASLR
jgi:hypothetical protein